MVNIVCQELKTLLDYLPRYTNKQTHKGWTGGKERSRERQEEKDINGTLEEETDVRKDGKDKDNAVKDRKK